MSQVKHKVTSEVLKCFGGGHEACVLCLQSMIESYKPYLPKYYSATL